MESLDYKSRRVHVNKATATYAADGSVRVIVASDAPPQDTSRPVVWLDPSGHECGAMTWRWIRPNVPDHLLPEPRCRVMRCSAAYQLPG